MLGSKLIHANKRAPGVKSVNTKQKRKTKKGKHENGNVVSTKFSSRLLWTADAVHGENIVNVEDISVPVNPVYNSLGVIYFDQSTWKSTTTDDAFWYLIHLVLKP